MKKLFSILLLLSTAVHAQTTTTLAKLKATAATSYSTVYRIVDGTDTAYYKAFSGVSAKEDGTTVFRAANGGLYVKLIAAVGLQPSQPTAPVLFSNAQMDYINKMIDSAANKRVIYFDKSIGGDGTKEKPLGFKQN